MAARKKSTVNLTKKRQKKDNPRPQKSEVVGAGGDALLAKSRLSRKQKFIIAGGALLAIALLISGRGIFVAATVNGTPVTRLEVIRELEKQGGKQVLDSLINEKLILSEARKKNAGATESEIDAKIEKFKEQLSAQGQDYDTVLELQGVKSEELRKQVRIQVILEKLLADRVSVSDDEIAKFIETNKSFMPENMNEDQLKNLAREELIQQKLSGEYANWLNEIKASAKVNYLVEY